MNLRDFFRLRAQIVGNLPSQITNGTAIDATQVMADLTFIKDQVNANALQNTGATYAVYVAAVGGTANAITLAPSPAITSYAPGQRFSFLASGPNTGATTINVSGLGAQALQYADGTAMTGGEMLTGAPYDIEYNGSAFVLLNSAQATGIVTFTPTVSFGGASVGVTYSLQSGVVSKIGRMAFFSVAIVLTSKGSSVGTFQINGLPYVVNALWLGNNAGPLFAQNVTFSTGYLMCGFVLGGTGITVQKIVSAGASVALTDVEVANNSVFAVSGFYST